MAKIDSNLAAHLRQQYAFLRALRHFVQHRRARDRRTARTSGVQPCEHRVHLTVEVGREIRIVLERAFGQQQRGRVLHRERFRHAGSGQLVEALDERRGQLHQRAVRDLDRLVVHRRQRLLEFG